MRNFGNNVKTVHTVWIVKEGDEFKYPSHTGIAVTPPEWVEKGLSQKIVRIVYPVEMKDGRVGASDFRAGWCHKSVRPCEEQSDE